MSGPRPPAPPVRLAASRRRTPFPWRTPRPQTAGPTLPGSAPRASSSGTLPAPPGLSAPAPLISPWLQRHLSRPTRSRPQQSWRANDPAVPESRIPHQAGRPATPGRRPQVGQVRGPRPRRPGRRGLQAEVPRQEHDGAQSRDAAIGSTKRALIEMGRKHGRAVHLVHPAYTTMDCAQCGARTKHALPLSERTYACTACGAVSPRDKNSARVMLVRAGLNPAGADRVRADRPPVRSQREPGIPPQGGEDSKECRGQEISSTSASVPSPSGTRR